MTSNRRKVSFALVCWLVLAWWPGVTLAQEEIVLGMFAYRPKPGLQRDFQPLADYLGKYLATTRVKLLVLDQEEIQDHLANNRLDLVLTNPSHYLQLRSQNSLSGALATMISMENGITTSSLGGVIITRSDNPSIQNILDLRGRRIAIPGIRFLGGYQAQAFELMQAGIQLPRDARLAEVKNHDNVIAEVLAGRAEAGFVRTGVIEQLARDGKLDPRRLRVINRQPFSGFPFVVSTRLYPEWPFVALPHVEERLVRKIAAALMHLDEGHPAARAAHIGGFSPPADYLPVENLARALKLPPYDYVPPISLGDIWRQHRATLVVLFVASGVVLLLSVQLVRRNRQLSRHNRELDTLIRCWPEPMLLMDGERFISVNPAAVATLHYSSPDSLVGRTPLDLSPPLQPDGEASADKARRILDTVLAGTFMRFEWQHLDAEGTPVFVDVLLAPLALNRRTQVLCSWHDITERKHAEDALKLAASVFESAREGILITDTQGGIVDVNGAFTLITGYRKEDVLGRTPAILKSGQQNPEFYADMWRALLDKGHWYGEVWNRRKNGETFAELLTISAVHDKRGMATHYVGLFSDISAQKEHQRQLEHIAHYDALTGLPNRTLFSDRLRQAMAQAQRRGLRIALAYVDLDGFKAINDTYGHKVGDHLLIRIAQRMKESLREGDTIARLGGDEFVALLIDLPDNRASTPLVQRLLTATSQPVATDQDELQVSGSIGVTFYPQAEEIEADQLLRQADQAMYQAKLSGKNRYHLFDAEEDRNVRGHHESLERIRLGLDRQEFVLYYQPKVNMRTGEVIGVEALVRWQHPERGLLPPTTFLGEMEEHALGIRFGEWVIATALGQARQWREQGLSLPVSVNISAFQLQQPDFMSRLRAILSDHADPAGRLEFEVLETNALNDMEHVSRVIKLCADIGVDFALDDFGTGYSSLTYLKRLPASVLKIDQSFVRGMLDDPEDLAILQGIMGLSRAFRRRVVAEGVESVEHGKLLLRLDCELAQGYAIARPMPAEAVPAWLGQWQPHPEWRYIRRISQEDMTTVFAAVELRSWVRMLEDFVLSKRHSPPEMDSQRCRFAGWLRDAAGGGRYPAAILREEIEPAHQRLHLASRKTFSLHMDGRLGEIPNALSDMRSEMDHLLASLDRLLDR